MVEERGREFAPVHLVTSRGKRLECPIVKSQGTRIPLPVTY